MIPAAFRIRAAHRAELAWRATLRFVFWRLLGCRVCEHCASPLGIRLERRRTPYPGDRATWLCRPCASRFHAWWDEVETRAARLPR